MAGLFQEEAIALSLIYDEDELDISKPLSSSEGGEWCGLSYKSNTIGEEDVVVSFTFKDDTYPNEAPRVSVIGLCKEGADSLRDHVLEKSANVIGEAMLYTLIEEAKNWLTDYSPKDDGNTSRTDDVICQFFLKGKCRFGDKCHNRHAQGHADGSQVTITGSAECVPNPKAETTKEVEKTNQETGSTKKKPMKTATDVISRILWDEHLLVTDFVVGYLDRFIGIVEKAFTEFSWEDIATVDYSVLAIPKHRIQYFKYKGTVVWDKRVRLDNVFGSTGSKETILAFVQSDEICKRMNEYSLEDCKASHKSMKMGRVDSSAVQRDEPNSIHLQRDSPNRPNFFLCFKITEESIKAGVEKIQKYMLSFDDRLLPTCLSTGVLHVTLCMFRLDTDTQKQKTLAVLKALQPILVTMIPSSHRFTVENIGNFHGRVLHAQLKPDPVLIKFVSIAMRKLEDAGVKLIGNYEPYTPHLTLMKLSRHDCKALNLDKFNSFACETFSNYHFGHQCISRLLVCSTGKVRGDDGFYLQLGSVGNSLTSIYPELPGMLQSQIVQYVKDAILTEEEGDSLIDMMLNDDDDQVEKATNDLKHMLTERMCSVQETASRKVMIIMRGLPGSGKSHFVERSIRSRSDIGTVTVCSADTYFDTVRDFDVALLADAHAHCRQQFLSGVKNHCGAIVVDNTHSQCWEYGVYKLFALLFGYTCKIVELECQSEEMLQRFSDRCQHVVGRERVKDMYRNWQHDPDAKLVPARFTSDATSELQLATDNLQYPGDKDVRKNILYSALYLDEESRQKLLSVYRPVHGKVSANHMTIQLSPLPETIRHVPVGEKMTVKAVGYVCNDIVQAVAVEEEDGHRLCTNSVPHVTISVSTKAVSRSALDALQTESAWNAPPDGITLSGTVGIQVAISAKESERIITRSAFDAFLASQRDTFALGGISKAITTVPQLALPNTAIIKQPNAIITSLFVFDFDGTMFETPDPVLGRRRYKEVTGRPWPFRGFLSRPQSLEYPLHVNPGPALEDFLSHCHRESSYTVVMTGRLERVRPAVESVLRDHGLQPDRCILKPEDDDASAPAASKSKVPAYKKWTILELLKEFPDVVDVKLWDDRTDNIRAFRQVADMNPAVRFHLFHAREESNHSDTGVVETQIMRRGKMMNAERKGVCANAVSFISSCWSQITGLPAAWSVVPFGSYKLGCNGDIDLCMLAPRTWTAPQCMTRLSSELTARGVGYVYAAERTRCPRMKVCIYYHGVRAVDLDLVFACCCDDSTVPGLTTVSELSQKASNEKERMALEGPVFWADVEFTLASSEMTHSEFAMLLCACVVLLKMKRQKGNPFCCIRSFHIVSALKKFVMSFVHKKQVYSMDELFRHALNYLAGMTVQEWTAVCAGFVPDYHIYNVMSVLDAASRNKESTASLFRFDLFPMQGHCTVCIQMKAKQDVKQWRAFTVLQARLCVVTQKLVAAGIEVFPGHINCDSNISFAVMDTKQNELTTTLYLNELVKEFSKDNCKMEFSFARS